MPRARCATRPIVGSATPSSPAPTAVRDTRSSPDCPTTDPARRWPTSRCAIHARRSTTTRRHVVSTPSRPPAPPAVHPWTPTSPGSCRPSARVSSWPSRGSAAITWPVTHDDPRSSPRCANASSEATSPSPSWCPTSTPPGHRAPRRDRRRRPLVRRAADRPRAVDRSDAPGVRRTGQRVPRRAAPVRAPAPPALRRGSAQRPRHDERERLGRADLHRRRRGAGAPRRRWPICSSITTGASMSRATTRWCARPAARRNPCAAAADTPRCR